MRRPRRLKCLRRAAHAWKKASRIGRIVLCMPDDIHCLREIIGGGAPHQVFDRARIRFAGLLAFIVLLLSGMPARGSIIPTSWSLGTGVTNNQTQDFSFLNAPPSLPFNSSHTATLGSSTALAYYTFQQGANYVDYLIHVQHSCTQVAAEHTIWKAPEVSTSRPAPMCWSRLTDSTTIT